MIWNGVDNGKQTSMILIDLQKTFDTLHHKILWDKMKSIGFPDKTMKWFYSHLKNRDFFCLIRYCLFGIRDHKLWSSLMIYIRTFIVFTIHKWCSRFCQIPIHVCMQTTRDVVTWYIFLVLDILVYNLVRADH